MPCLSGFELYSRWVPLTKRISSHYLNSKCNGPVLFLNNIFWHKNFSLSSVAKDDKDTRGFKLKLEKLGHLFQVLMLCMQKLPKKILWSVLTDEICAISYS